jgi:hypothetical protein
VEPQQVQPAVDGLGESEFAHQEVHGTNAPVADAAVGSKLGFLFLEDGVGGRTISFNTIFKTNWTPATTANDKNWIEFVYDGTHWLQTSATTVAL